MEGVDVSKKCVIDKIFGFCGSVGAYDKVVRTRTHMRIFLHDTDFFANRVQPMLALALAFWGIFLPGRLKEYLAGVLESCTYVDNPIDSSKRALSESSLVEINWRLWRLFWGAGRGNWFVDPGALEAQPIHSRQQIAAVCNELFYLCVVFSLHVRLVASLTLKARPFLLGTQISTSQSPFSFFKSRIQVKRCRTSFFA